MMNLIKIINEIKAANRIAIISHISPDGDAVGSSLGLALALKSTGKTPDVYLQDGVPSIYSFLTGSSAVLKEWDKAGYDIAIAVDCGDLERLGNCAQVFNSATIRINLDHHVTNTNFGDFNHIETNASSAGEMIYRIIKMSDIDLDKDMAQCLYVAIATDTGGFRFSNTTSICMQVAADLINCDIDISDISRKIFDVTSEARARLLGAAINTLELFEEGQIAAMSVSKEQKEKINTRPEDFDGVINIARNISGVEAAVMLVEKELNEVKVNLRSNKFVDVSQIVSKYSGGGHKRAAGCTLSGITLQAAKDLIVDELRKSISNNLNRG